MPEENEPSKKSSQEKKYVSPFVKAIARWSPLGFTGYNLCAFLIKQELAIAIFFFLATAISSIWAAYSKSLIEQLSQRYSDRGRSDADALVDGIDLWDALFRESLSKLITSFIQWIKWKVSRFDRIYLDRQVEFVEKYITEGLKLSAHTNATPMMDEVFVQSELRGVNFEANESNFKIWELIRRSRKEKKFRQMIILREGGFGKTTLLKHVTLVYGQGKYRKHKVHKLIPFLIFLWEWKKDGGFLSHSSLPSLSELINKDHLLKISEGKEPLNLPVRWVNKLLVSGKALVMFDGFDELPEDQRQRISHWISEQMQKYKYVVFIITSRPAVYKDYVAEHSMMPLTIQDFSPNQQADFVKRWYLCQSDAFANIKKVATSKSENLLSQLRDPCRPELQQLAKNPLLLYLLVNFHSSSPNKELPRRRIELYTKVCKLFLEDRPKARGIKPLLTEGKSQEVLQLLALHLVEKDRFMIVNEELLSFLREIPVFTLEDVAPEDFLCQMVEVGELLVKYRSNEYEFRHYSFQGYLAATCLAQKKDEVDDEVFYNWNIEIWRETILFYTSYLGPDRLTKLLRRACYGNKLESISVKLAFDCLHEYGEQENLDDNLLVRLKALTIDDPKAKLYVKLIDSLKESRWGEADVATYKLMLKVANSEERGWLRTLDVESFPDEDLQEINKLWVKYSDKKFGFSVQKELWLKCGGKIGKDDGTAFIKFEKEVYWYRPQNNDWSESAYHEFMSDFQNIQNLRPASLPRFVWKKYSDRLTFLFFRKDL